MRSSYSYDYIQRASEYISPSCSWVMYRNILVTNIYPSYLYYYQHVLWYNKSQSDICLTNNNACMEFGQTSILNVLLRLTGIQETIFTEHRRN